jgi:hypothetical protein
MPQSLYITTRAMIRPIIALFLVALLLAARGAEPSQSDARVGTTDTDGRIIIHVFDGCPAHLSSDFGIVMCHAADGWVRFTLARKAQKSVREFSNYNNFLEALAELPKGSVLTIYDRCSVPLFYDFYPVHQELHQKFSRDCRKRGLKLAEDPRITCTCTAEWK